MGFLQQHDGVLRIVRHCKIEDRKSGISLNRAWRDGEWFTCDSVCVLGAAPGHAIPVRQVPLLQST